MELVDYVRMLRRQWVWVVVLTVIGITAGVVWGAVAPRRYRSHAELFVGGGSGFGNTDSQLSARAASEFALDRVHSYAALVDSPEVVTSVAVRLGRTLDLEEFTRSVSASVPPQSVLIRVSATNSDPATAVRVANTTAEVLRDAVERLETPGGRSRSLVKVSLVRPAQRPSAPVTPNRPMILAVAGLLGLALGLLCANLRDQLARNGDPTRGSHRAAAEGRAAVEVWLEPDPAGEAATTRAAGEPQRVR